VKTIPKIHHGGTEGTEKSGSSPRGWRLPSMLFAPALVEIGPLDPAKDPSQDMPRTRPLSIVARTSEPFFVVGVDDEPLPVHHDLSGMDAPARLSIDREHDPAQVVGWGVPELLAGAGDAGPALAVSGLAVLIDDDCPAAELMAYADLGVPFDASIHWEPASASIEELAVGQSADVNGRTVDGPALIVRKWRLRNVSIVLNGADRQTGSYFLSSQLAEVFPVTVTQPTDTAPTPTETAADPALEEPVVVEDEAADGMDLSGVPSDLPEDSPQAKLAEQPASTEALPAALSIVEQFTSRFGAERGVEYLRSRLPYRLALEADHTRLGDENARLAAQVADLQSRLSQTAVGHRTAPTFGSGESREQTPTDRQTCAPTEVNVQRFMRGVKLPHRN
jgi:hypothetical protein